MHYRGRIGDASSSLEVPTKTHGRWGRRTRVAGKGNVKLFMLAGALVCILMIVSFYWLSLFDSFEIPPDTEKRKVILTKRDIPENGYRTRLSQYAQLSPINTGLVQRSVKDISSLFRRAAEANKKKKVAYATLSSPVLAFHLPKTGSNTIRHYVAEGLASVGHYADSGCQPPDRTSCLAHAENVQRTSCNVAFQGHFQQVPLLDAIIDAELSPNAKCQRFKDHGPLQNTQSKYREVLQKSVCFIILREPVDRAIASYYEWHYQKTSNLTAIEYLEAHGPEAYLELVGAHFQLEFAPPQVWEATLENCLVGVTETMDDFTMSLARIFRITPPEVAVKYNSHPKPGMTDEGVEKFYKECVPLLQDDINLWLLAGNVARSQQKIAASFPPLTMDGLSSKKENVGYYCETPYNATNPYLGIHWYVFDTPGKQVGFPFDHSADCKHL